MQLSTINSLQAKLVKKMSRGYRPYLKVLTSANPGLARNKRRSIESIHKFKGNQAWESCGKAVIFNLMRSCAM